MATEGSIDQRLVKALAHPLRLRILAALNRTVSSPSELAEELSEPLGNVSYHVRILADLNCIELVRTTPRRGAVEHHYRATVRPWFKAKDWGELPQSVRRSISGEALDLIFRETTEAAVDGSLDSIDSRHISRTQLVLDDQGWDDLTALLADLLEQALEIESRAADRLATGNGDQSITSRLVVMHYPAPEDGRATRGRKGRRTKQRRSAQAAR
jgi:DNA-binding transcriptional ArsR family regulator